MRAAWHRRATRTRRGPTGRSLLAFRQHAPRNPERGHGGWNAGAHEGLLAIRDRFAAEVRQVETRSPAEFEEGFRDFAGRGFRLVFGHGFEYQEAAAKVGAEFPETIFVTTSGSTVRDNVLLIDKFKTSSRGIFLYLRMFSRMRS